MLPSLEPFFLCDSVDGFNVVTKLTVVGQLYCNFIERLPRRFRRGRFVVKLGCTKEQGRYGLLVILERPLCSEYFQLYRPSLLHSHLQIPIPFCRCVRGGASGTWVHGA